MKTWYMTKENDLQLQYGQIRLVKDLEALRVRIDAALQVIKGELDDLSLGVDYFGIIFSNTPISMKIQEISRVILSIDGVEDLTFDKVEFDKVSQTFRFYFKIYTVYGNMDYDKIIENPS